MSKNDYLRSSNERVKQKIADHLKDYAVDIYSTKVACWPAVNQTRLPPYNWNLFSGWKRRFSGWLITHITWGQRQSSTGGNRRCNGSRLCAICAANCKARDGRPQYLNWRRRQGGFPAEFRVSGDDDASWRSPSNKGRRKQRETAPSDDIRFWRRWHRCGKGS